MFCAAPRAIVIDWALYKYFYYYYYYYYGQAHNGTLSGFGIINNLKK